MMTPETWTAFGAAATVVLTAAGALVAAIVAAVLQIKTALDESKKAVAATIADTKKAVDETKKAVDATKGVVAEIQDQTNGHAAAAAADKKALELQVKGLEERLTRTVEQMVQAAGLAKQSAADVRAERAAPAPPAADEVKP